MLATLLRIFAGKVQTLRSPVELFVMRVYSHSLIVNPSNEIGILIALFYCKTDGEVVCHLIEF